MMVVKKNEKLSMEVMIVDRREKKGIEKENELRVKRIERDGWKEKEEIEEGRRLRKGGNKKEEGSRRERKDSKEEELDDVIGVLGGEKELVKDSRKKKKKGKSKGIVKKIRKERIGDIKEI